LKRIFRFFGRAKCEACHKAKGKVEYFLNRWHVAAPLVCYDVDAPEGMAEGAWYDVAEVPTVILEDGEQIIGRWKEKPPLLQDLKTLFDITDNSPMAAEET
jgi:hypothetical protein